jgi:poly-beta-1,6 N-acetyl-D-glucosamine synthase
MRRYTAVFASGVIILCVLGSMAASVLLTLAAPPALKDGIVSLTALLLVCFLAILVVRYFTLLWLGFLQHIEDGTSKMPRPAEERSFLPPVTILVPAYNEGRVIGTAIRSLLRLDYPRYEILVIDDGSTDDTFARASEMEGLHGTVRVRVVSKSNAGKAAALNTGIALAHSPFVLCMDADSVLAPQTLLAAIRHFEDPRVGAVAGNVKVHNRVNLWTRLQALEYIEGLNMPRRAQGFMRAVNIIPGPVGVFRRSVLTQVGGYDTDTFAEDADLTLKLLEAGWRITYEDEAIASTEAPERLIPLIKQRYRWTRGILQALRKRAGMLVARDTPETVRLSLTMMWFEALVWPAMNVLGSLFFVVVAIAFGAGEYLLAWWLLLTLLDIAAALHTVAMEEESLALVPFAVIYRFFFILLIDVSKLYATFEELLNLEMSWGKLQRTGRVT